ncbi:MAG: hypothetical protein JST30_11260 [Armatimonadetes bacterium]|nr:hypothetical protein [Armatimonadota bacterium]
MNEVPKLTQLETSLEIEPAIEEELSKRSTESPATLDGDIESTARSDEADGVDEQSHDLSVNIDQTQLPPGEQTRLLTQDMESQIEFLRNKEVVQRDSGKTFIVTSFFDGARGKSVQLHDLASNARVNLNLEDFIEKVTTPGSPWRFVE